MHFAQKIGSQNQMLSFFLRFCIKRVASFPWLWDRKMQVNIKHMVFLWVFMFCLVVFSQTMRFFSANFIIFCVFFTVLIHSYTKNSVISVASSLYVCYKNLMLVVFNFLCFNFYENIYRAFCLYMKLWWKSFCDGKY